MSIDRTIILDTGTQRNVAMSMIELNWLPMANADHPMAVRIYEHKDKRTRDQNSLMWIRLAEIEHQAWLSGRQFSADVWHEHFKREYLPDEIGPTKSCRKGYRKWDILPSGDRALVGSTTGLTTFGMSEYMTKLMACGADLGVRYSATPEELQAAA